MYKKLFNYVRRKEEENQNLTHSLLPRPRHPGVVNLCILQDTINPRSVRKTNQFLLPPPPYLFLSPSIPSSNYLLPNRNTEHKQDLFCL